MQNYNQQLLIFMDILNKTIKKLSEEEYQELLNAVSGKKRNKPFIVLENARTDHKSDSEMMEILQVNPSAYYTLKSRLNDKIASLFSKNVQSPVNVLMNEVTKVPAHLYGTNRDFSVRALIDLEKQLIEYDLSSELIIVYKTLAQLHLFTDDYSYYDNLYKKHVAFSLAVTKAEGKFFQFIRLLGQYGLKMDDKTLEDIVILKRELLNICEMYDSHRLFVIYNIVNIYYQCSIMEKREGLKSQEIEIEKTLNEITSIFTKYSQDTFYQNINFIVDFLNFEYYQKTNNQVRADFYYDKVKSIMPSICNKHFVHFFITQFLKSKIEKYLNDNDAAVLCDMDDLLGTSTDIGIHEAYHYITMRKFLAVSKFYNRDFSGAAKTINDLRNSMSLKKYLYTDVECKLFQALQYCMMGEDGLCQQLIASVKRQLMGLENEWEAAFIFIKMLKTALKPTDFRKKIKRINDLWAEFNLKNTGKNQLLKFLKLEETYLRKMSNPIKEQ